MDEKRHANSVSTRPSGGKFFNSLDLPAPIASHSATYHELVRRGAAELGTTINDYRFYRFAISYPPIKSVVMVRWKLPAPPSQ